MEIKSNLGNNQMRKVAILLTKASELGMDVSGYGFADENKHSGNVYLWLEDYSFTLYIGLGDDEVMANWSDPYDGEEHDTEVGDKSLYELEQWTTELNDASESANN